MTLRSLLPRTALAAGLLLATPPLRAQVYESFDYAAGVTLGTLNGGLNWSGPWVASNNGFTTRAPGLAYGPLAVAAGSVSDTAVTSNQAYIRPTNLPALASGERWFSFLLRLDTLPAPSGTPNDFVFWAGLSSTGSNATQRANSAGLSLVLNAAGNGYAGLVARLGNSNSATVIPTPAAGATSLIVGKFVFNAAGNETMEIWLNPDPSLLGTGTLTSGSAAAGYSSVSVNASLDATQFAFNAAGAAYRNNIASTLDEIRIGGSFVEVSGGDLVANYTLTTIATNGSVSRSPDLTLYPAATAVTLTATPAPGYEFTQWSGDLTGTANPAVLVMDANKSVTAGFTPAAGFATVELSRLFALYDGTPKTVTVTTAPAGLATTVTYDGNAAPPSAIGSYLVTATITEPGYTGGASATLTIAKAPAQITLSGLTAVFDGAPKPVTVTTVPAGLATTVTYAGSASAPSAAGRYSVVATVNDPAWVGTTSGTLVIASAGTPAATPWRNLNPGGGGQIQDLVLDPNIEGRAFHLSDVEGLYRTDDHGQSWQYVGQEALVVGALEVTVEPGNSSRAYLGTINGLQVSDNGGLNWGPRIAAVTPNPATQVGEPIQVVTIAPADVNRVYAGPGGTFRWDTNSPMPTLNGGYVVNGEPSIYRTFDRGNTWTEVKLATGISVRREVFSIAVDPSDPDVLYVANRGAGVFRSTNGGATWTRLPRPAAAEPDSLDGTSGKCWGLTLSPDGRILYASYVVGSNGSLNPSDGNKLFATPTASINWTALDGTGFPATLYPFWKPVIDPRSSPAEHKLLISQCSGARIGLYEVTVNWDAAQGQVTSHSWSLVGTKANNPLFNYPGSQPYDPGWENYTARALQYSYTPVAWSYRGIWTTQDQTSHWVDTSWPNWQNDWRLLYCKLAGSINGIRTYTNVGFHSTFNWDVAADGSYMLTGNADNAVVESFDSGHSWTIQGTFGGNRTNAVAVALTSPRIALAHRGTGFGAGSTDGALYAKRLDTRLPWNGSTGDRWFLVGGGTGANNAGLGNNKISTLAVDPLTPQRVYFVVTAADAAQQGIWVIDDIEAQLGAASGGQPLPAARRILAANIGEGGDRKVQPDPYLPGVIWANYSGGLHRGARQPDGSYVWTPVVASQVNGFAVWGWNSATYVARYFNNGNLLLSADGGSTWSTVLTTAQAVGASGLVNPVWYQRLPVTVNDIRGLTGHGNTLVCAYGTFNAPRRHAGVLKGTLTGGTSVSWQDWTDDVPWAYFSRAIVNDVAGEPWFIGATQGAGVWGRPLDPAPQAATITLGDLTQTYNGTPRAVSVATTPAGLATAVTYDGSASPPVAAGSYAVATTITTPGYAGSASATLLVNRADPVVTWPAPGPITYGTPLDAAQLNATADVPGAFTYLPPAGTVLDAGASQLLTATFTPADPANYNGAQVTNLLRVDPAPASISLGNLLQTYDGTPRSASVTTAPAGLPVSVTYAGDSQPPTATGSYAVVATVTHPNYVGSASDTLVIARATPVISWPAPAPITYGTALSGTQLNATSPVTGTFAYAPPAGTILPAGSGQILNAVFTPADADNYTGAAATTVLDVNPAPATITLGALQQLYDGTPRPVTVTTAPAGLATLVTYDGSPNPPVYPGSYAVTATIDDANHAGTASATLLIGVTARVRHGFSLAGEIDGPVQVLLPESITLQGHAAIMSELFVPGTPEIRLDGQPVFGGIIERDGSPAPAGHRVTLSGRALLRHLVIRSDASDLPAVAPPPAPAGNRDVVLTAAGQDPGDFATVRHLTVSGQAGLVPVPPGTYGDFVAGAHGGFVFGTPGATAPAHYDLTSLRLAGQSRLVLAGPVVLTLHDSLEVSGRIAADSPAVPRVRLLVSDGGVTLLGSADVAADVVAPAGTVTIGGTARLEGSVAASRLSVDGILVQPEP